MQVGSGRFPLIIGTASPFSRIAELIPTSVGLYRTAALLDVLQVDRLSEKAHNKNKSLQ